MPVTKTPKAPGLSDKIISSLRKSYSMDAADRATHNAVTNTDLPTLALNREALRNLDNHFSHRISTKGITHQHQSGRCWIFAALNTLRPKVILKTGIEDFEFSATYLQFWDKLERANLYLEAIIEHRNSDFLDREWETLNRHPIGDGGWWNFVTSLIHKYGLVPKSAMPETHSSSHTETLNHILERLLHSRAAAILTAAKSNPDTKHLQSLKQNALHEIYRLLVINLGEPPTSFTWRYKKSPAKKSSNKSTLETNTLTPLQTFTPKSFFTKFVGSALDDYHCLYNDPKNKPNRHYSFKNATNIHGAKPMSFANISMADLKKIAISSIKAGQPLWFAVNMSFDQSTKHGLMHDKLFDYEALFNIDLSLSKADRALFHFAASNHAMTLIGVDLDPNGKPRKWLVENSWGKDKGNQGLWTIHHSWFDEHTYTIIAHKNHIPKTILNIFTQKPTELPAWYPGSHPPHDSSHSGWDLQSQSV